MGTARIIIRGQIENPEIHIRALCDNGSQVNLITNKVMQKLGLKYVKTRTNFLGVGGTSLGSSLGKTLLHIKLKNGTFINDNFFVVKNITNYSPNSTYEPTQWNLPTSQLADSSYNQPGQIEALLGVGIWIQIMEPDILKDENNQALAQNTKLGYVIFENQRDPYQIGNPYIGAISKGASIEQLSAAIHRLWEIEELPKQKFRSDEEKMCEEFFEKTHTRDKNGRYIVRIPFNDKIHTLGKSKTMALRQFFTMEGRMKRNPDFASKYRTFISEYEALGHMSQIYDPKEEGYYTPHHGVLSSTKFRVVFNASAKTTSGISLNETQLVGEKLQPDLFVLLINFRRYQFGMTADIEKMYRQVLVHPDDRKYQKIVWRNNESEPIRVYQLNTVTYGHACAPHCAVRALIQCASDNKDVAPRGSKIIRESFYVDDLLTGAHTIEDVQQIRDEVSAVLEKGGFRITKWKTNGHFHEKILLGHQEGEERSSVLGLCWDLNSDTFMYKLHEEKIELDKTYQWTKRRILSKIAKLYDPNGYLGPITMAGKIIMQELWKNQLDWDDVVSGAIAHKWGVFNNDLKNIREISIPRWLGGTSTNKTQLHGFCDASNDGFGAVVYCRVGIAPPFQLRIIASRSRVAPLKTTTIPRLELCAANLLVDLMKIIINTLEDRELQTFCWTDSRIVLQWMARPPSTLKTFVANRVANIQAKSKKFNLNWKWVAGNENPADLISRGSTASELQNHRTWWKGPEWFQWGESHWPSQGVVEWEHEGVDNEVRAIHLATRDEEITRGKWFKFNTERQEVVPILQAYSNYEKLLGVIATLLRACHNFKNPKSKQIGNFTRENYDRASAFLVQLDQRISFAKEIEIAKQEERVKIGTLATIWDNETKVIRIDGRIQSKNLTRDEQFPILLSKYGNLATLLIHDAHMKTGHGGTQLVLQYLRSKYWIIGARSIIKNIVRQCTVCFKQRMATSKQLMASLPINRTTPGRPFAAVGIDYAGPVTVRFNMGRAPKLTKAWIAVFVCLVTRAIHLELVSSASTAHFIAALKRMIARRGMVSEIVSDNGTNFVGANNFLQELAKKQETFRDKAERKFQLKWTFVSPGAPHHGGIYEAAVKSVKYHITRIIGEATLTFEEYQTILSQVESYVNSRPICALTDDPTDLTALTPGHFLIGEPLIGIPETHDFRETPDNRLDRWEHLQKMQQHFWAKWHNEYLGTLINRSKWREEMTNIKEGDLVIIKEENIAPMNWRLARIQEVLPGKDGLVRTVILRTSDGVYKRPITKLGVLYSPNEKGS